MFHCLLDLITQRHYPRPNQHLPPKPDIILPARAKLHEFYLELYPHLACRSKDINLDPREEPLPFCGKEYLSTLHIPAESEH
jgi:hypothetical protein